MLHHPPGEKALPNIQMEPPKWKKKRKKEVKSQKRVSEEDLDSIWFGSLDDSRTKYPYPIRR